MGPIPGLGTARNAELGVALHAYVTQQWSTPISAFLWEILVTFYPSELKGGSKQVRWKDIENQNKWYISQAFLIEGKTFKNPTRLSEKDLRAYWKHWLNSSQSGKPFTFKKVGAFDGKSDTGLDIEGDKPKEARKSDREDSDRGDDGDEEEEEGGPPSGDLTPDQCGTDEAKISFLQSLLIHDQTYQAIINSLAQMRVGYLHYFIIEGLLTEYT